MEAVLFLMNSTVSYSVFPRFEMNFNVGRCLHVKIHPVIKQWLIFNEEQNSWIGHYATPRIRNFE